ncbi:MAG: Rrf2 family transcriptional regulator [Bacteroidales bacterium]|nr:Rrf2 family transcriptional regulator [Bacteroidales bacterium]
MLSKKAEYSLCALLMLARNYNKGPILISKIAESENIPKKFLENILYELKSLGVVMSKKGKGGGYFLKKKPEKVNLVDIIRHFDGAIALLPCVSDKYYKKCCHNKDENICGLKYILKKVRDESVRILENNTLADAVQIELKKINKK